MAWRRACPAVVGPTYPAHDRLDPPPAPDSGVGHGSSGRPHADATGPPAGDDNVEADWPTIGRISGTLGGSPHTSR